MRMSYDDFRDANKEGDFELFFGSRVDRRTGETVIDSADVPVRWCVSESMAARMRDVDVNDPHVLIHVVDKWGDEVDRQFLPLNDVRTYIRFNKPGKFDVFAWIINIKPSTTRKDYISNYLGKDEDGEYVTRLGLFRDLNGLRVAFRAPDVDYYEGDLMFTRRETDIIRVHESIEVPENSFAKDPPSWLKWYGNLWHKGKPKDECDFRKRMLIGTIGMKWIAVALFALGKPLLQLIIAFIFALCGWMKGVIIPSALLHPFNIPFSAGFQEDTESDVLAENTFLYRGKDGRLKWYFAPFIPLNLIVVLLVGLMVGNMGISLALLVAEFVVILITYGMNYIINQDWLTVRQARKGWRSFDQFITERNLGWQIFLTMLTIMGGLCILLVGTFLYVIYTVLGIWGPVVVVAFPVMTYFIVSVAYNLFGGPDDESTAFFENTELKCPVFGERKDGQPLPPSGRVMTESGKDLPQEISLRNTKKRTLKLKFHDIKYGMCKPMRW